jgi:hypothetical protein
VGVIDDSTIDDICIGQTKYDTIDPFVCQPQGADRLKEKGSENAALCFSGWKGD